MPKHVVIFKLHLVNKIIYSQDVFDSLYLSLYLRCCNLCGKESVDSWGIYTLDGLVVYHLSRKFFSVTETCFTSPKFFPVKREKSTLGWRERNQQDATNLMFIIKLLSQHVSGIIMPIIRRTRVCTFAYGVLHWLWWLWLCRAGKRSVCTVKKQ